MLFSAWRLGSTGNASNAVDIAVQLHVSDTLQPRLALALCIPCGPTRTNQTDTLLQSVNVLRIASQQLVLRVESLDKVVGRCGNSDVDFLFELGDEGEEDRGGGGVAEEGGVKEVSAFQHYIWIALFHQIVESI